MALSAPGASLWSLFIKSSKDYNEKIIQLLETINCANLSLPSVEDLTTLVKLSGKESAELPDTKAIFALSTEVCVSLAEKLCMQILKRNDIKEIRISVCAAEIMQCIFGQLPSDVRNQVLNFCENALLHYLTEQSSTYFKGEAETTAKALTVIDLIQHLAPYAHCFPNEWKTSVFSIIEGVFQHGEDRVITRITQGVLPLLMDNPSVQVQSLWKCIHASYSASASNDERSVDQSVLLLCSLADIFFPVEGFCSEVVHLLGMTQFWEVIQSGLFSSSPLSRKRTSYLLKRILDIVNTRAIPVVPLRREHAPLFWWDPRQAEALFQLWATFVLVAETLEEKQTHVIKPVLNSRMKDTLLKATISCPEPGAVSLHFSWMAALLTRMSHHESTIIKEWALKFALTLDYQPYHLKDPKNLEFLMGHLLKMLTDSKVYSKPGTERAEGFPSINTALATFFTRCHSVLHGEEKEEFFQSFFKRMSEQFWNGSCLVFILQAISQLPAEPVLGPSIILPVREMLTSSCTTVELHIRGAIQCFFMKTLLHLLNYDKVSPAHLASVLAVITREESIMRGEALWDDCVSGLEKVSTSHEMWSPENIAKYLQDGIKSCLLQSEPSQHSTDQDPDAVMAESLPLVRLLLLTCDAGLIPIQPKPGSPVISLDDILSGVIDVVSNSGTRIYMDPSKVDCAIEILTTLLTELKRHGKKAINGDFENKVHALIQSTVDGFLLYAIRQRDEMNQLEDLVGIFKHVEFLSALLKTGSPLVSHLLMSAHLKSLLEVCSKELASTSKEKPQIRDQLLRHVSLLYLVAVCDSDCFHSPECELSASIGPLQSIFKDLFTSGWLPSTSFQKPADSISRDISSIDLKMGISWGQISSSHISKQWSLLHYQLTTMSTLHPPLLHYIDACYTTLDILPPHEFVPMFKCLCTLLKQIPVDDQIRILSLCYSRITEDVYNLTFWPLLEWFLHVVISADALCQPVDSPLGEFLSKTVEKLQALGQEKSGVMNALMSAVAAWMEGNLDERAREFVPHASILLKALMFGPIHSKGKRFVVDVQQHLLDLGSELATNQLRDGYSRCDKMVRVLAMTLLAKVASTPTPGCRALAHEVLHLLVGQYEQLAKASGFKTFCNSLSHREKHRLVCALFVLEPALDESLSGAVVDFLWRMLRTEVQPSIRCYFEWLMARLMHKYPSMQRRLWEVISQASCEKKAAYFSSLLSIISFLVRVDGHSDSEEESLFEEVIPKVLPWCMAHHFNLRVYAQAALLTTWGRCQQKGFQRLLNKFCVVGSYAKHIDGSNSPGEHAKLLMNNVTYKLHPFEDLSIETLTHTLPRMCMISDAEWTSPDLFSRVDSSFWKSSSLPLYNTSQDLAQCQPGMWRIKIARIEEETPVTSGGDVQKKLIPWRGMLPDQDLELDISSNGQSKKQSKAGGLVVVTSLIDKVPNLGGLCRTSEIFGVSEFVIGNLGYINDPMFESLSVSAQKWIPITEVPPTKLPLYLVSMREQGYTLVGVEQTAQSQCLTQYTFPEKTLLLLGNEKEGIPVELIQLLDVCVEIPQQGVIRSLNVHVSGALLIWEYARQQLRS